MEGVTCAGSGPECFTGRDCRGNSRRNPGARTRGRSREGAHPVFREGSLQRDAEIGRARGQGLVLAVAGGGVHPHMAHGQAVG